MLQAIDAAMEEIWLERDENEHPLWSMSCLIHAGAQVATNALRAPSRDAIEPPPSPDSDEDYLENEPNRLLSDTSLEPDQGVEPGVSPMRDECDGSEGEAS